jgi:hypothetical protein
MFASALFYWIMLLNKLCVDTITCGEEPNKNQQLVVKNQIKIEENERQCKSNLKQICTLSSKILLR